MRKIALCIGNNKYEYLDELSGAENDAEAIAKSLRSVGFEVIIEKNIPTTAKFESVVGDFAKKAESCDLCLFFYAGHGFEIEKKNILAHTELPLGTRDEIHNASRYSYKLDEVIQTLVDNSCNCPIIIIIDACRDDPSARGGSSSFAPVQVPQGCLIAFSTSPGQKSKENKSTGHGYYTEALLEHLTVPLVPVETIFKQTRQILFHTRKGQQIPWEHTSLINDVFIAEQMPYDFQYSDEALADAKYTYEDDDLIDNVIQKLKTYDYYSQNPAIDRLQSIDYSNTNINKLFVLGRNIYQAACGGSFRAQNYIEHFYSNNIQLNEKIHILNGMAYEIYFDKNSDLRKRFKDTYYTNIIKFLEMDVFSTSKAFINHQLSKTSGRLIYHPDQADDIKLEITIEKWQQRENVFYYLMTKVKYKNVDVFSCSVDQYDQMGIACTRNDDKTELKTRIARHLLAPKNRVSITYNIKDDDIIIYFPEDLIFKYYVG